MSSMGRPGGIDEIVERYPDASSAGAVMAEIRTVLDACGSSEFQAIGRADGFAGDDSLRFVDNRDGEHVDWVVVLKGNLIAMLPSPVTYGLTSASRWRNDCVRFCRPASASRC